MSVAEIESRVAVGNDVRAAASSFAEATKGGKRARKREGH
jgi:hypothetical protein